MDIALYPYTPDERHLTLERLFDELSVRFCTVEAARIVIDPDVPGTEIVEVYGTSSTPNGTAYHLVTDVDCEREETVVLCHLDLSPCWHEYRRIHGELVQKSALEKFDPGVALATIRNRCLEYNGGYPPCSPAYAPFKDSFPLPLKKAG